MYFFTESYKREAEAIEEEVGNRKDWGESSENSRGLNFMEQL